jgi:truncated hemoglobin YjbI
MAELTLYERIGGAKAIDTMVVDFYNRVLSNAELQPFLDTLKGSNCQNEQVYNRSSRGA